MSSGPERRRRAKITVEAIVEITDEAAVIEAALASIESAEFSHDGERERIRRKSRPMRSLPWDGWRTRSG